MKNRIISVIYFSIGIFFIIVENNPDFLLPFILKALIIPVLAILFMTNLHPAGNRLHLLMLFGLFFSWAGDVLLELPKETADLFIPGLACFLLAHAMYLSVFFLTPGGNFIFQRGVFFFIPLLLYGVGIVYYLYDGLGNTQLPVILYTVVILTMLAGAINRLKKVNASSFWLALAGAVLFLLSDSALAVNKFGHHFTGSSIVIMLTYVLAQYLIVTGYISQFRVIKAFKQ